MSQLPVQVIENTALAAVSRAEIDIQISTARQYPRDIAQSITRMITHVCIDEETAAECRYSLKRGEKTIQGPSIRMAEIAAMNYGNIRVQTHPPIIGEREVTVGWAAHDLESNYATSGTISSPIQYGKYSKSPGRRYDDDMIGVTAMATTAKARRNGIVAIVPGAIFKKLMNESLKMLSGGDQPIEARREKAIAHFRSMGVDNDRILAAIGKPSVQQITNEDIANLRGFATAIKEGNATIDNTFPDSNAATGRGAQKTAREVNVAMANAAEPTVVAEDAPAFDPHHRGWSIDTQELVQALIVRTKCSNEDAINSIGKFAEEVMNKKPDEAFDKSDFASLHNHIARDEIAIVSP